MNATVPKGLLRSALILSLVAFVSCPIVAISPFLGFVDLFVAATLLLFLGLFPLFFGAVSLLQRRAKGRIVKDWVPILFLGLPEWFVVLYRLYFFSVWLGALVLLIATFRGHRGWFGLLFILVPSVFYATCAGAFWSELKLRETDDRPVGQKSSEGPSSDEPST